MLLFSCPPNFVIQGSNVWGKVGLLRNIWRSRYVFFMDSIPPHGYFAQKEQRFENICGEISSSRLIR